MKQPIRLRVEGLEDRLTPNTAGTLDPTYGTAGVAHTTAGKVYDLTALADGRSLAVTWNGSASALVRFGPDGTLDPSFGNGGTSPIPGSNAPIAPTADGGAYVGSVTTGPGGTTISVVYVTAAGTLDQNFGTGGTATVPIPGSPAEVQLAGIVVQPDGRILVSGDKTDYPLILGQPQRPYQIVVARLTSAGQLDPSFGTSGTTLISDPTGRYTSVSAGAVTVQSDGRVVIAGTGTTAPIGSHGTLSQLHADAVRLLPDGRLDPSFGVAGFAEVNFPDGPGFIRAVSTRGDGRIVLAGQVTQSTGVAAGAARLFANGTLDASYGSGGTALTPQFVSSSGGTLSASPSVTAAIDPSGRAVFDTIADANGQGTVSNTIYRMTADGNTDTGFGTNGQISIFDLPGVTSGSPGDLALWQVALQANGDVLLGGTDQKTQINSGSGLVVRLIGSNPPAGFVSATAGAITAGGAANGTVQVLAPTNGTYATAGTIAVYPGFPLTVRATTADVNGDGTPDYVNAAGPGGVPVVTVFDGKTGNLLAEFLAFESSFTGGLFVAAADLDGDGKAEIVATPDLGGGSRVVAFSIAGGAATPRASFFGIDDPNFRGGARLALGDVNKDGTPDLLVAAGFGGGPRVALFDGKTVLGSHTKLVNDFFAFPEDAQTLRNGVFAALGDVNGDGNADAIFGGGPGGAPRVYILSGQLLLANSPNLYSQPVANFFVANNSSDRGGVRVAAVNADGDTRADVVVGSGEGSKANVRVYLGKNFTTTGEPGTFQDISVFGGATLPGGVFVG